MNDFAVSIVTPVFNVRDYLDEMVESVLRQDLGFERNIQLVLVDDGSTDGSADLCNKWAEKHPGNIRVLHQKNQRQAVARKNGLALATGRYVGFCDPDDLLSKNACRRAAEMLDANPSVDMATLPVRFFGAVNEDHRLNAKFKKGSRVLDLLREPESVTILLATSFFRREALSGLDADTSLPISEDSKETLRVLIRNPRVCLAADAMYFYRRHTASTMASWTLKKGAWIASLEHYNEWTVAESERLHGKVLPFVWHTMVFDLSWHFSPIPDGVMTEDERASYRERMLALCRKIDDDVLLENKWIDANRKSFLLANKRNEPLRIVHEGIRGFRLMTSDGLLLPCRAALCKVFKMEVEPNGLRFFAQVQAPAFGNLPPCELLARLGGRIIPFTKTGSFFDNLCADRPILRSYQAEVFIPVQGKPPTKVEFLVRFAGFSALPVNVSFAGFSPVRDNLPASYFRLSFAGRSFLLRPDKNGCSILPCSAATRFLAELRFDLSILCTWNPGYILMLLYRWSRYLLKPFSRRRTWLLMDRPMHASGDAFALFRYLCAHKEELRIHPKFVLHPKSADWKKVRRVGPVIPFTIFRYGLASLLSDWTISSREDASVRLPFRNLQSLCCDIAYGHRFALFPSEDAQTRSADLFSRMNADASLLFLISNAARDMVRKDDFYGYGDEELATTGLPRFDLLAEYGDEGPDARDILFAPSWRPALFGNRNQNTGECPPLSGLENSTWFRGLRETLLSEPLVSAARERGFRIRLMPHPECLPALSRFSFGPKIDVVSPDCEKRDVYPSAAICVTDDPDVAADFAFLRRPVVFFRPDGTPPPDEEHLGPIGRLCRTIGPDFSSRDDLVAYLVAAMRDGFPLLEPYRSRMESVVPFRDGGNSRRVTEAILAADQRPSRF